VVTDHLTRLYNRRFFMNRAEEELSRSLRTQQPLSLVILDIDHFKHFNDAYGHATGDRVLQVVAAVMKQHVRKSDICSRHGGEEFGMLLPNTPGDNASFMANRLRRTLAETRYTGLGLPSDVNITISMGVATCPRDATVVSELFELADKALYEAKAEGRDRVIQYGVEVQPTFYD
jgi:diguanylate cyclase (GGDEF)-like protein